MRRLLGIISLLTVTAWSHQGCNLGGEADRLTYDAVAPEYSAYVAVDPRLTEAQKQRRFQTLRSWEAKLPKTTPADVGPQTPAASGLQSPADAGLDGPPDPLEAGR